MKGKFLKVAAVGAVLLLCILVAACQVRGASSSSETALDIADRQQEEAEALGSTAPDDEGTTTAEGAEEWPGQAEGYIGPNGEGALDYENYSSRDEYLEAIAGSMAKQVETGAQWVEDDEGRKFLQGTVCVYFRRDAGEARCREIVGELGGLWVEDSFAVRTGVYFADATVFFESLSGEPYESLEAICERFGAFEEVVFAEPLADAGIRTDALATGDTEMTPLSQYYLESSGFVDAWTVVKCMGGASIAVLDFGIEASHEDLEDNIVWGYDASTQHVGIADSVDNGHGTRVCGIASARAGNLIGVDGASYNADLAAMRICDDDGNSPWLYVTRALGVLCALGAVGQGVDVVNMSFESPSLSSAEESATQAYVDVLYVQGTVCVAAIGNLHSGETITDEKYPAKLDKVVGVGSVDRYDVVAPSSNRNAYVDIAAPGVDIYSTTNDLLGDDSYGTDSGTSFAAPQVAAAAALLKRQNPTWTPGQIIDRLLVTARKPAGFADDDNDGRDDDNGYGHGILDAAAAVGWTEPFGGGSSPFTGPGDDFSLNDLQVAAQQRIQATRPEDIPDALARAMGANPDVFAWLYVPGTRVSTPVARREGDDSYYLEHDPFGNPSPVGCAYIESGSSASMADAVTAVYGHSFSAGSLALTSLHAFEDYSFFANHGRVYVYLPGRRLSYRVVGAYLFTDKAIGALDQSDPGALADYFASLSDTDPSTFVGFKRGPALDPSSDRVLQLSTCTVPAVERLRFVVTCVYEGEAEV